MSACAKTPIPIAIQMQARIEINNLFLFVSLFFFFFFLCDPQPAIRRFNIRIMGKSSIEDIGASIFSRCIAQPILNTMSIIRNIEHCGEYMQWGGGLSSWWGLAREDDKRGMRLTTARQLLSLSVPGHYF
jgi:hypothetical protein